MKGWKECGSIRKGTRVLRGPGVVFTDVFMRQGALTVRITADDRGKSLSISNEGMRGAVMLEIPLEGVVGDALREALDG